MAHDANDTTFAHARKRYLRTVHGSKLRSLIQFDNMLRKLRNADSSSEDESKNEQKTDQNQTSIASPLQVVDLCNVVQDIVEIMEHSAIVANNTDIVENPTNIEDHCINIAPKIKESKDWQKPANNSQVSTI